MSLYLPESSGLRGTHVREPLSEQAIGQHDHVLLMLPASAAGGADWPTFPHAALLSRLLERLSESGGQRVLDAVLPDERATGVTLGFTDAEGDTFSLLSAARRVAASLRRRHAARVAIAAPGFTAPREARVLAALVGAVAAGEARMPSAKRDDEEARRAPLTQITTFGACAGDDYRRELAEAEGNALARWLSLLPSNALTVSGYLARIDTLAARHGWDCTVMREAELAAAGANAFLAVARGSRGNEEQSPPALVHLRYRPAGIAATARAELALVGKGICFDTGGVNVKSAQYMQTMNEDMQGSAVALGTLLAITRLGLPIAVDAWLALAENAIGPAAYKPQDVITAANGTTIEVVHTDAEGRMVLADTLHLAGRESPQLMVDLATLTGACVNALTTAYSGVFTNRPELHDMLIRAGRDSGERVWPFPLDEDFDKGLESDTADVKQCAVDGRGDHILAARFLQRFVPKGVPWVHVDLAASRHKGGLAHVPTDVTGFGVRFLMNLLLDQVLREQH